MPIKLTRTPVISASAKSQPIVDPCDEFKNKVDECVQRFRQTTPTPSITLNLENELETIAKEACRKILERELNQIEPADKKKCRARFAIAARRIASTNARRC